MADIVRQPCDQKALEARKADAVCPPEDAKWILAATIIGSSMAFIDSSVVNVALPAIQKTLGASLVEAQWVVVSYALFVAALILVGGSLGDHYGRKRIFSIGIVVFTISSICCGLAGSPGMLITARAVQGIGGALLIPGSLAIISASFDETRRGRAIGTWAAFTGITSVLGPVLGGYLVDHFTWRWVFFINVPFSLAVLAITFSKVPESRDPYAGKLDPWGAALVTLGLSGIVFGLIESSTLGFGNPWVISSLIAGVLFLAAFLYNESRLSEPMMPPELFYSQNFTGSNLFTLILYFALGGLLFFFPLVLIQAYGYSATAAGAAFVPSTILMVVLSRYTGALTDRFGPRLPLISGPVIVAVGFALFALPTLGSGSYWATFFPAVIVLGLGLAVMVPNLTTVALNSAPDHQSGLASGVNNAFSRVAYLLAIAVLGVVAFSVFSSSLDNKVENLNITQQAEQLLERNKEKLGAAQPPEPVPPETAETINRYIAASFAYSFRVVALVCCGVALISAVAATFLIQNKPKSHNPD